MNRSTALLMVCALSLPALAGHQSPETVIKETTLTYCYIIPEYTTTQAVIERNPGISGLRAITNYGVGVRARVLILVVNSLGTIVYEKEQNTEAITFNKIASDYFEAENEAISQLRRRVEAYRTDLKPFACAGN
ncbi:MAG: hypothetical protein HYR96_05100 [Deltaproteobacteria bacterium]|nr:hypothetical protein [Deltaproteobacteria bacterium]MBI3295489.1 hypothetical protein [Deltaproteobacteria bacterium]